MEAVGPEGRPRGAVPQGDWPDTLGEMVLAAAQGKALGMSGGDLSVVSTINRLGLTAVFGPPRVKLFEVDLRPGEALMNPAQGSTA